MMRFGEQKLFLNLLKEKTKRSIFLSICLLFVFPCAVIASDAEITNIKYWSSPDYTRVVIELSGPVNFSKNHLTSPDRLYFDLLNVTLAKGVATSFSVEDGVLKSIRAGLFNPTTVRVVLDLESLTDCRTFMLENPVRLVIDVQGSRAKIQDRHEMLSAKRRIVIDAGHGGHDPGAVGLRKLYEKDVVLDISLKVKTLLSDDPLYEVCLTREKDVYLSLDARTAIANRKNADLFVSIHANASQRREAKGIETYLLNWTDDEEALRVAARENQISLKKMRDMNRKMDIVDIIKSDLMRENKRDESIKLANYIQRSLVSNLNERNDLGVKQALFYVLFGARMPSVLVEVSFMSNPEEERLLSQESYRMEIARAIVEGIKTYFQSTPMIQKVVELRSEGLHYR
ncbi:MAG: N-acetylmuramoyl-L-alanine amidase [Nitrospirota bacterium]